MGSLGVEQTFTSRRRISIRGAYHWESHMMGRRIAIIQGHPAPRGHHFGHALADAYATGAEAAGREVKVIEVACLDFPLLRTKEDWENKPPRTRFDRPSRRSAGQTTW